MAFCIQGKGIRQMHKRQPLPLDNLKNPCNLLFIYYDKNRFQSSLCVDYLRLLFILWLHLDVHWAMNLAAVSPLATDIRQQLGFHRLLRWYSIFCLHEQSTWCAKEWWADSRINIHQVAWTIVQYSICITWFAIYCRFSVPSFLWTRQSLCNWSYTVKLIASLIESKYFNNPTLLSHFISTKVSSM